jgi:hypothetical protein
LTSCGGSGGRGRIYQNIAQSIGQGFEINYNSYNSGLNITPPSYSAIIPGGDYNGSNSSATILQTAKNIRPDLFGGNGTSGLRSTCTVCSNCVNAGGTISYGGAGAGGDGLYIICNVFILTGTIDLRGENGIVSNVTVSGTVLNSGSGAGGGGSLIVSAENISNNTGIILTNGGIGSTGTCSVPGGNGGNGSYLLIDR